MRARGPFDRMDQTADDGEESQSSYYYEEEDNLGELNNLEMPGKDRNPQSDSDINSRQP